MTDYQFEDEVHCADFIGRDKNIKYGFDAQEVEQLIEKVLGFMQLGGAFLPPKTNPEALAIEVDGETLTFSPGSAQHLASSQNERAYLLSLTINQEYQRWATRFVSLSGKMDIRQGIEGLPLAFSEILIPTGDEGGMQAQPTQRKLESIAEALQSHSTFVILGDPGAGKTTTQQKLAFDAAYALLRGEKVRIPLFVRLSQQKNLDPYAFLKKEWERRIGSSFAEALASGRILILADGINEIAREKRNEVLSAWRIFEQEYRGRNQLIFSGRTLDYDNQLNLPRVQVEPLDRPRISEFLKKHQAEGLEEMLDDTQSRLHEMASNPLNLFVLAMVYLKAGKNLAVLKNRGRLFFSFTQELLLNEQLWHPDEISTDNKVALYAQLAYAMQKQSVGTTFDLQKAQEALPATITIMGEELTLNKARLFHFGRGATILDPVTNPDIRFYHHLLQEYFAARELLRRFNQGEDLRDFWRAPRFVEEMPPVDIGEWDPLPEPLTTGWEVTTILAVGLAPNPQKLIEAVRTVNPILAGRCLDEAGLAEPEKLAEIKEKTQANLLADLYNPKIDLRARLLSGLILGRIGDPRFPVEKVNGIKVILPKMVTVPAGEYLIGSPENDKDAFENESPPTKIKLDSFKIGKWSLTNAEYACFMEAGGYENEAYWTTDLARRWLAGEEVTGGQFASWLSIWKQLQDMSDNWREQFEQAGSVSPEQLDSLEYAKGLTEDELKEWLGKGLNEKSRSQPAYWNDARFNNPSQPVVGITWFEAQAYSTWLSELTGTSYRLPTEAEWEASARGLPKRNRVRVYPWGDDWDKNKANSIEGRVQKTSPVGAYTAAGNLGSFKTEDQSGNVWNWTSSLYLPYPYDAQSEIFEAEGERTLRGGSWPDSGRNLRAASRDSYVPDNFNFLIGFRLLSPGSVVLGSES